MFVVFRAAGGREEKKRRDAHRTHIRAYSPSATCALKPVFCREVINDTTNARVLFCLADAGDDLHSVVTVAVDAHERLKPLTAYHRHMSVSCGTSEL